MKRLTRAALARPRTTLAIWGLVMALLAVAGLGVQDRLREGSLVLPGTESARAVELSKRAFGTTELNAVLLTGPAAELDKQGPRFADEVRTRWTALSPWDPGKQAQRLRPSPTAALMLVDLRYRDGERTVPRLAPLRRMIAARVRPPVEAHVTSNGVGTNASNREAIKSAADAQKIAFPVLLLVLLLVFRSPIAAAIPAGVGLATIGASAGVIALLADRFHLTGIAVSVAAMMGLALGVDYSLLIVSRFREEMARPGVLPRDAAATAAATAGRTVVFAGIVLVIAMALALALSPGDIILSLAGGVVVSVVLSLVSGAVAVPAALALVGANIDRWRIGSPRQESPLLTGTARAAMARPLLTAAAVLLLLLAIATPLLGLRTSPPVFTQLPPGDPARTDFEALKAALNPGYGSTFELIVHSDGPITEPARLRAIQRLERTVAKDPGVTGVVGPGRLAGRTRALDEIPKRIAKLRRDSDRAAAGVGKLRAGLARAAAGLGSLRSGAQQAAEGSRRLEAGAGDASVASGKLAQGSSQAVDGARQLAAGIRQAEEGARTLRGGADRLTSGTRRLADGIARAEEASRSRLAPGARRLAEGLRTGAARLGDLREPASTTTDNLNEAYDLLTRMTVGKGDPNYLPALRAVGTADAAATGRDPATGQRLRAGYPGLVASLDAAQTQLRAAADGADQLAAATDALTSGLADLRAGSARLVDGANELSGGNADLASGLALIARQTDFAVTALQALTGGIQQLVVGTEQLSAGAGRLTATGRLADGAGQIRSGLEDAHRRSGPLQSGLARAGKVGVSFSGFSAAGGGRNGKPTPEAAGHFVLAGVANADTARRNQAAMVVNAKRAGDTARIYVVPHALAAAPSNRALRDRLVRTLAAFQKRTGFDSAVGGLAGLYVDYHRAASSYIPLLIACLSLVTFLLLVVILRALLLPLVAVLLNVVIVAASFGALKLLFQGDPPLLGGPGFVDVISVAGIFTILFALSIDYQVFLLTRMHEGYVKGGDPDRAVLYGIGRTATVVTGAALIMTGVFLSFATSEFSIPRQFGVGLAVAVILDAILLRLLLLPAAMKIMGRRGWWIPRWLDRRLPRLDVEGTETGPERAAV